MNFSGKILARAPVPCFLNWPLDTAMILGYIVRFVFIRNNCCFHEEALNNNVFAERNILRRNLSWLIINPH